MRRKPRHPNVPLFEYLGGSIEPGARQKTEEHLAECEECASVAALVRALKTGRPKESQISETHPDVSELAGFFYAKSPRRDNARVAAHVALCRSCAEEIAQYACAEYAASGYEAAKAAAGEVPAKAWEMIRDWEDSSFAKFKPAREVLGKDMLTRLSALLKDREPELRRMRRNVLGSYASAGARPQQVPVIVVSRSGEVRSVEVFDQLVDSSGATVLRHAEGSQRFDNKAVHLLLDFGEKEPLVVSNLIRRDTICLEETMLPEKEYRRKDFVIIED